MQTRLASSLAPCRCGISHGFYGSFRWFPPNPGYSRVSAGSSVISQCVWRCSAPREFTVTARESYSTAVFVMEPKSLRLMACSRPHGYLHIPNTKLLMSSSARSGARSPTLAIRVGSPVITCGGIIAPTTAPATSAKKVMRRSDNLFSQQRPIHAEGFGVRHF